MKSVLLVLGIVLIVGGALAIYLWRAGSPDYTLELHGQLLETAVDLSGFEGVTPDMTKQEVAGILGQTAQIRIQDDQGEEFECWQWGRTHGIIRYYFECTPDGGIGSPEYLPNHLTASQLFRHPLPFDLHEDEDYVIKVRGETTSLTVTTHGSLVTQVNYYWR